MKTTTKSFARDFELLKKSCEKKELKVKIINYTKLCISVIREFPEYIDELRNILYNCKVSPDDIDLEFVKINIRIAILLNNTKINIESNRKIDFDIYDLVNFLDLK